MKMTLLKTAFLVLVLCGICGTASRLQAQVRETPATIALEQGGNPQGFIQGSKPGAILFSPTQGVRGVEYPLSRIRGTGIEKLIRLDARSDSLANPLAEFNAGNYLEAAKGFDSVVKNYQQIILHIPQNFASEAMYYQIESLRRIGNYKALGPLVNSPAGKSLDTMLSDRYKAGIRLQKLWAVYGSGDMAALEKALGAYQEPVVGRATLLPAPNFKKMPQNELAQISYLRAELFKSKGENEKALEDYFRVFSLAFGYEPFLTKQAMGAAMVIQSKNPDLKSEKEKVKKAALREIQSVAYFFSKRFPNTEMPAQFKQYAVLPEVEIEEAPKEEEKPEEGENPDTPGAGKGDPKAMPKKGKKK